MRVTQIEHNVIHIMIKRTPQKNLNDRISHKIGKKKPGDIA
jgi:hypothetical protein